MNTGESTFLNKVAKPSYKIFYYLYLTKSFSKTATLLGMSQPTISRRILEMEDELGITIVERDLRPIRFTPEGQMLFQLISQISDSFNDRFSEVNHSANKRYPLRLGTVGSMAGHTNASIVKNLQHEISKVELFHGSSSILKGKFDRNEIDLFISSNPYFEEKSLYRRYLYTEPAMLITPKGLELPEKVSWKTMRFCGLPMLFNAEGTTSSRFEKSYFNQLGLDYLERIIVEQPLPLFKMVAEGLGWGIADPSVISLYQQFLDRISVHPLPSPSSSRDIYVISKPVAPYKQICDKIVDICALALSRMVKENVFSFAPWAEGEFFVCGKDGKSKEPI